MDYRDWEILKVIHEEHNLTNASKKLFISQPALSFRLKRIEQEIGVPVLIRHPNGVFFTPQGEKIYEHGCDVLDKWEELKKQIAVPDQDVQGDIRLGISSVVAKYKMAGLLKKFSIQFPKIKITLTTGSSTLQLPQLMEEKMLDIAILRGEYDWKYQKYTVYSENWCWVGKSQEQWDNITKVPWIQYQASKITRSRQQQYLWWKERFNGQEPETIEVDSIEASLEMVSHGFGWSIIPQTHLAKKRFVIKPLFWKNGEAMLWNTTMICAKDMTPAHQTFMRYVINEYSKK